MRTRIKNCYPLVALAAAVVASAGGCVSADGARDRYDELSRRREELFRAAEARGRELRDSAAQSGGDAQDSFSGLSALDESIDRIERLQRIEGPLSLADAVSIALSSNLEYQAVQHLREGAFGDIEVARAAAFPSVGLSASAQAEPGGDAGSKDSYSVGLTASQALWRGGSVRAGIHLAWWYSVVAEATVRQKMNETIYGAATKYRSALLCQHLVKVYEEAYEVADRLRTDAKTRRRAGTVSDYEVLRAEVEVANTQAELLNRKNDLRIAMIELLHVLGVAKDSDVQLSDRLEYTAEDFDSDEMQRLALSCSPSILSADATVRAHQENLKIVRSGYYPSLDAFLTGTYRNPDNTGADDWDDDWTVGVKLTQTLTDGSARHGKLVSARADLEKARVELTNAEENARTAVVTAMLQLRYAEELYQSQKKNTELAGEALRMVDAGARRGKNTQVELLDARAALTEAMGNYYNAVYKHEQARMQVRYAAGQIDKIDFSANAGRNPDGAGESGSAGAGEEEEDK